MTKAQLVAEITKRLGDPSATAFGDRAISYFVEAIQELYAGLSEVELINTTAKDIGLTTTTVTGIAIPNLPQQVLWAQIIGLNVNGVPATRIDKKEYTMMISNSIYAPSPGEFFYYFDGRQLLIITGESEVEIRYEVLHLLDPTNQMESIGDDEQVPFMNTLLVKAIPIAVSKLKQEVGLML